jgi:hypothetical protein
MINNTHMTIQYNIIVGTIATPYTAGVVRVDMHVCRD